MTDSAAAPESHSNGAAEPGSGKQPKKVFVGGLSWDTTESTFSNFFSKYGEIKDSIVMKDKITGRSRGFGFITFADVKSFHELLKDKDTLEIDGRKVEVKDAVPQEQQSRAQSAERTKKIFVGGLHTDTTEEEFKTHFAQFGEVSEASIMFDADTQRSRGFGFVTFVSEDTAQIVLGQSHQLTGRPVECKPAVPKRQMAPRMERGGGGGRGGYYPDPGYYEHPYARSPMGGRGGGFRPQGGYYGRGYRDQGAAWAAPPRPRAPYDAYGGAYGGAAAVAPPTAAGGAYDYGGGGYAAPAGYGAPYAVPDASGYPVAAQGAYAGYQDAAYASEATLAAGAGGGAARAGGYAAHRSERPSRGYMPYARGTR